MNPSQIGLSGKSNTFPIIGYPLGPGGYATYLDVHFFLIRESAISVPTTTRVVPAYFSNADMVVKGDTRAARDPESRDLI